MGTSEWLSQSFVRFAQKLAGDVPVRLAGEGPANETRGPAIVIRNPRVLPSLLLNPEMAFGDGYSEGQIEVEGDLVGLLERIYHVPKRAGTKLIGHWLDWFQTNTLRGSRRNIHHHYDLSNDFYLLWLDRQMVYTCAYFPRPDATLEEAQTAKMDLVCRKVGLRPEESVVEAGCGWGALALHMARHYGVRVKAFNISHEQIVFARDRAKREGLSSRVEFIEDDYRNISGRFDAFVSVGMLEHLGPKNYVEFGRVIHRTIGDYGRGLLHFIGRNSPRAFSVWMRKRVFPGAYAPSLQEAMDVLEPQDLSVVHLENLRAHYAKTLEHWLARFEQSYQTVVEKFGPRFARMWRLYLAGSLAAFRVGGLQLFQIVFAGNKCASLPWTWSNLYEAEPLVQEKKWIHAIS
ncbi:MAG TPA: cyclopropane-fatty-acyl-phospholipid synthase family protein [Candidatus Angelobacter sp.]|nr:cyclopropane-fatty-acyl-phospholipid synthase family protein [Candidatus Angelobacter sp.]